MWTFAHMQPPAAVQNLAQPCPTIQSILKQYVTICNHMHQYAIVCNCSVQDDITVNKRAQCSMQCASQESIFDHIWVYANNFNNNMNWTELGCGNKLNNKLDYSYLYPIFPILYCHYVAIVLRHRLYGFIAQLGADCVNNSSIKSKLNPSDTG